MSCTALRAPRGETSAWVEDRSGREHRLQPTEHGGKRLRLRNAQLLHQTLSVQRAQLVEQDQAALALQGHRDAKGRGAAPGRHRCDDDRAQMFVHLGRRYDDAGPRLLDLAAERRIERGQPDLPTPNGSGSVHQRSAASPSFPNSGQARLSSAATAIARLASAQPSRGAPFNGRSTMAPFSTFISAPSVMPTWASKGFGMMTPSELPSLRRVLVVMVGSGARMTRCYNMPVVICALVAPDRRKPPPRPSHRLGEQLAPDQHAPDLAGAGADLVELGVAPQPAERVVVDVAVAAEDLHALAGHPGRLLGAPQDHAGAVLAHLAHVLGAE